MKKTPDRVLEHLQKAVLELRECERWRVLAGNVGDELRAEVALKKAEKNYRKCLSELRAALFGV